ncbi:MAG: ATP-grasp domain-containing protein, partial [Candidatus Hodarchaeales archaeon]
MGLILEYEGKELFRKYRIPTLPSHLVTSVEEAKEKGKKFSFPVAVKAQVLSGGRGKRGLIQIAHNMDEVVEIAKDIFMKDDKGIPVTHLLIEEGADIKQEIFISMLDDRTTLETMILFSME